MDGAGGYGLWAMGYGVRCCDEATTVEVAHHPI